MNKANLTADQEFEQRWNNLSPTKRNFTKALVVVLSLVLIGALFYIYSQRHHDSFVDPKIKLQSEPQSRTPSALQSPAKTE